MAGFNPAIQGDSRRQSSLGSMTLGAKLSPPLIARPTLAHLHHSGAPSGGVWIARRRGGCGRTFEARRGPTLPTLSPYPAVTQGPGGVPVKSGGRQAWGKSEPRRSPSKRGAAALHSRSLRTTRGSAAPRSPNGVSPSGAAARGARAILEIPLIVGTSGCPSRAAAPHPGPRPATRQRDGVSLRRGGRCPPGSRHRAPRRSPRAR